MKTRFVSQNRKCAGYALMMVMAIAACAIIILAATMSRTITTANLNVRNNQYNATLFAAEAATEKVVARMIFDYRINGLNQVSNNVANNFYRTYIPTSTENPYWSQFVFSDGQGNTSRTYVQCISNTAWSPLTGLYSGLGGWKTVYRVLSNARQINGQFNVTNAVQEDVEFDLIPVFQFAIFYNGLLEFTWCAKLTVRGKVHANGSIYVGSVQNLAFSNTVSTTDKIYLTNWDDKTVTSYGNNVIYSGNPTNKIGAVNLTLPIGTNGNAAANVYQVLLPPPAGEDVNSAMGQQRYYNNAGMVIIISNSTVSAVIKSSPSDTGTTLAYSKISYFVSTNVSFYDDRENKTVKTTQIDVGKFKTWIGTNSIVVNKHPSDNPLNILYVADFRTTNSSTMTAVRLTNGIALPSQGLTVATPNPLYVMGNYNAPVLASTNTSSDAPAGFASDALTILSPAWSDSKSSLSLSKRNKAAETTVNAAILSGIVYSTGPHANQFSGGAMNLPRLLEDWGNGSVNLWLNTSIVNLFNSQRATTQFVDPGTYYYAPTRQFNFDANFLNPAKQPPGAPKLAAFMRSKWANPPPNTVNYTYAGH